MKTALVLEGGGTRGLYTVGVLDAFMEHDLRADLVVGVSAGACGGASYVSRQPGRGKRVNLEFLNDKRYLSLGNYFREKSYMGLEFTFKTVPNELIYFDYDAFAENPCDFISVVTNAETGKTEYLPKSMITRGDFSVLQASSSLPLMAPPAEIGGVKYFDGGLTDSIPVRYAVERDYDNIIVVLTQPKGYRKPPQNGRLLFKAALRKYPAMMKALEERHIGYNETLDYINELEAAGRVRVLRPSVDYKPKRFDKDVEKLTKLYELGKSDALELLSPART